MIAELTTSQSDAAARTKTIAQKALSQTADRSFEEIAAGYWDDPNRGSALAYLESLSQNELRTIAQEHGFADPTPNIYGLNLEGSNNLLRQRRESIDENGDGIFHVGESKTWYFPNSSTPDSVVEAWQAATAEMSEDEAMLMAGLAFMPRPQIHEDPATGNITVVHPGEPGYQPDPKASKPGYFYESATRYLESLDDPRNPPVNLEFYAKAKRFFQDLVAAFESREIG